jgi:flagellar biosynthesis anti-sigma factor FlgM
MRIALNAGSGASESALEKSGLEKSASSRPTATAGAGAPEESRLSTTESSLRTLAGGALGAPEFRQARVEALRAQIVAGTYQVSAEQIAASLLDQLRVQS